MNTITDAFHLALNLIWQFDAELMRIIGLSLRVSLSAVVIGSIIGLPLGAFLALARFPGRHACIVVLNASMGLPPVVVGLVVYLILSRSGPLGTFGWLFTAAGMVVAQVVLITPIVAALSRQVVADLWSEYEEQLRSLGLTRLGAIATLLWDGRFSLSTAVLAGFGRAIAEVGAIIIVGGNIAGVTRTMTTAISLETSRGDLALAMALGIVLLTIAITINAAATTLGNAARRAQGA
ncbi:ABC transporter permease [Ferrovibrio sp.]|uniref:ABC transporter permease n=1 Tax=Ferrovibrio sp. TaxID=1917215 RepID=UPI00262A51CA|nr:ABC transporter permease [Ferrovibrio sp.]